MTVLQLEQLKTKVFPWPRVESFRRGERGKVCQNRGGITGSREKRTRRRLRDIDFIALSTNFARIGFFHAKKSHGVVFQVRFSKKITAILDGSQRKLLTNRERRRDPEVLHKSMEEDHRSDFGLFSR